jgi:hypothetical protein
MPAFLPVILERGFALALARASGFAGALLAACSAGATGRADGGFDAARAWAHMEAQVALGPRHCGSEAIEKARVYLEGALGETGLTPVRESFVAKGTPAGDVAMCNVYADLAPKSGAADAPMVILLSHYDTKKLGPKFVGANDGASSTAVLLELARVLAAAPPERLALRFLFVDGEEAFAEHWEGKENTYGSRHHADAIREDPVLFPRVKACVLLDLVGDRDLHLTTDTYSTLSLRQLVFAVAEANGLGEYVGGRETEIKDDHLSFRKHNIDAVDLIDMEYDAWHTDQDTLDKCSKESLAVIGKLVLCLVPKLEERYAPPATPGH